MAAKSKRPGVLTDCRPASVAFQRSPRKVAKFASHFRKPVETSVAVLVLVFFLSARQVFAQITPYTPDANTVLLDHFDGSTSASILGFIEDGAGDTQKASATPSYSYGPGPAGLGEALTLNPPAGEPLGSATYLKYSNELLSVPNGSLDFYVYLTGYGTPGETLVEQGPYYMSASGWTFNMGVDSTGRLQASAWAAFDVNSGTSVVKLNTWTQVAVTWGSAGAKLYIDGTLVGSDPNTGQPASGFGGSVLIRLGTSSGFSAQIDELRISNIQRAYAPAGAPPAPIPVSPQSGWTGVSTSPTLMWNASAGATSYELQVSTDSTFATTIFDSTGITDTLKTISGLSYQTKYFWRVNATGSSGTSLWSNISSFATSGGSHGFWTPTGGPPGGSINALVVDKLNGDLYAGTDSGIYVSTNNGNNWTLAGSGLSGSYVRALAVAPNGYIFAGNTNGVYISTDGGSTWNLSAMTSNTLSLAVSQSGEVFAGTFNSGISISTDNGSTWSGRGLSADEIYAVTVGPSGDIFAGVQNVTNYNYAGVYRSTDGANSWTQVGLMGDELWTIAIDSSGDVVAGTGQNGIFVSTNGGNNWSQSNSGLSNTMIYSLTVSSGGNIFAGSDGSGVFESTDRGNIWNATGPTDRTYWSLAATASGYVFAGADSGGVYRAGGGTSSSPPSPPTLLAPVNGATGTATELKLSWEASSGATSYRLQISTDVSFVSLIYDVGGLAAISDSMTGFATQTTYYWRVNASNSAGTSAWSSVWDFTTGSQTSGPSSPVLSSPANAETGTPTSLNLIWEPSAGADSYRLQVSTDASFSTNLDDIAGLLATSDSITGLSPQTTYYWHVDATNSIGTSVWSSTWSFTTGSGTGGGTGGVPSSPALISPVNYSAGLPTQLRFSWGPSAGAATYEFQISSDASFSTSVKDVVGLTVPTDTMYTGLSGGTTYYWRVNATDSAGTSQWSAVWQFTTANSGSLSTPTLASPLGTTGVWIDPVLSWNSASGATSYEVQVSTDPGFSTLTADISDLSTTSYKVIGLGYGTTYYWRVAAMNSTDVSAWSTSGSFTTLTYPSTIQVSFESTQFLPTNDHSSSAYRMVGLPGNTDIPMGNLFSGSQKYDWDAYYDNGSTQNYYVEYDGSQQFAFQPGLGFWVLSVDSFSVNQNVSNVQLDTDACYSVPVHSGWNVISDPFMQSVNWSSVQALNGTSQSLWSFDGGFQQTSTLDPYQGYYFYNDAGLSGLRIPYVNVASAGEASPVRNIPGKTLTATLSDGARTWSSIKVGASLPQNGKNVDIFAPPGNFELAGMCVVDTSITSGWKDFVQDFRDSIGTGQAFDFQITNKTGSDLSLKLNPDIGLNGYEIYLIDRDLSKSYNVKDTDYVTIPSFNKVKNFTVLIGDKSFIDRKIAELIPRKFVLYQNYPNPFNPTTVIRFEIPAAERVTIAVYDVLGRKVETLMDAGVSAGDYEVPFDGRRFASGVYFYRISAGSFVQARKMLLLK